MSKDDMSVQPSISSTAVRKSFFGGTVSTRDKCERFVGAIPLPAPKPAKPAEKPVSAAEQKRRQEAAARKTAADAAARKQAAKERAKAAAKAALADSRQPDEGQATAALAEIARQGERRRSSLRVEPSKDVLKEFGKGAQRGGAKDAAQPDARARSDANRASATPPHTDARALHLAASLALPRGAARPGSNGGGSRPSTPTSSRPGSRASSPGAAPPPAATAADAARPTTKLAAMDVRIDRFGRKVYTHTPAPVRPTKNRKGLVPMDLKGGGLPPRADRPAAPVVPEGHKVCRSCQKVKKFGAFFVDSRLQDGLTHACAECLGRKGITGKAPPELPPGAKAPAVAAAARRPPPAAAGVGLRNGFYDPLSSDVVRLPPGGAMIGGARGVGGGFKKASLDDYDYRDGFLAESDGEDDVMELVRREARKLYREERDVSQFNDRMMEATAAEIRREEARSKRAGRQEDEREEQAEALRLAAKAEKKRARKRKRGGGGLIDDEVSEDSDEGGE